MTPLEAELTKQSTSERKDEKIQFDNQTELLYCDIVFMLAVFFVGRGRSFSQINLSDVFVPSMSFSVDTEAVLMVDRRKSDTVIK